MFCSVLPVQRCEKDLVHFHKLAYVLTAVFESMLIRMTNCDISILNLACHSVAVLPPRSVEF